MTRVKIDPGVCGFPALVTVEKKDRQHFRVTIESNCEMVRKLGEEIASLTMQDAFIRFSDNRVYEKASTCLKHTACPVPSGILKALEVEAGLAVPRNVTVEFLAGE
ncbi:MAG: hypothetical protein GXP58_06155 [Deltaproteobacteria bacterium]|nr:hypothetical protein [Deltaproteobacteria bacterium]